MTDYISREAAIAYIREQSEELQKAFEELGGESGIYADAYNDLAEDFHRIPAADVEPVRHGRWKMVYPDGTFCKGEALRTMYALLVCSECGKTFELMRIGKPRYCICGAKMDLEEQNE